VNGETAVSAADTAFVALADHCIGCTVCMPDVDRPEVGRPVCPEAERLYWVWRRAERKMRG
jgi:hypothetical protein